MMKSRGEYGGCAYQGGGYCLRHMGYKYTISLIDGPLAVYVSTMGELHKEITNQIDKRRN